MIPFDSVAVISNLSPAEVESWLESEAIHRSRATDGTRLLCLNSLLKRAQRNPPGEQTERETKRRGT
jgi:hypothetical protein